MMPWTHFPLAEGDDWQHIDVINEFMLGVRERVDAAGVPLATDFQTEYLPALNGADYHFGDYEAGDVRDLQWVKIFQRIQDLVERIVPWFVNPSNFDITDIDPFSDTTDLFEKAKATDWLYDWPEVRTLAGLPAGGWTRKYPREISLIGDAGDEGQRARLTSDAKIYDHVDGSWVLSADQNSRVDEIEDAGQMEAGDYIGPWIFNEIVSVLSLLKYRVYCPLREYANDGMHATIGPMAPGTSSLTYDYPTNPTDVGGRFGYDPGVGSFAAAKTQAETEYNAAESGYVGVSSAMFAELRYSSGSFTARVSGTDFAHAIIFGNYENPHFSDVSDTSQIQIDFETYVYAHEPKILTTGNYNWSFNALNAGVVEDQWAMVGSGTVYHRDGSQTVDTAVIIVPRPGTSDTIPPWPAEPAGPYGFRGGVLEGFNYADNSLGRIGVGRSALMMTYVEITYTSNP